MGADGRQKKKKKKGTESWNEEGWGPDDQMNFGTHCKQVN